MRAVACANVNYERLYVMAAVGRDRLAGFQILDGYADSAEFADFLQAVVRWFRTDCANDLPLVVLLSNASVHRSSALLESCHAMGVLSFLALPNLSVVNSLSFFCATSKSRYASAPTLQGALISRKELVDLIIAQVPCTERQHYRLILVESLVRALSLRTTKVIF